MKRWNMVAAAYKYARITNDECEKPFKFDLFKCFLCSRSQRAPMKWFFPASTLHRAKRAGSRSFTSSSKLFSLLFFLRLLLAFFTFAFDAKLLPFGHHRRHHHSYFVASHVVFVGWRMDLASSIHAVQSAFISNWISINYERKHSSLWFPLTW